jgi:hypothetical protein
MLNDQNEMIGGWTLLLHHQSLQSLLLTDDNGYILLWTNKSFLDEAVYQMEADGRSDSRYYEVTFVTKNVNECTISFSKKLKYHCINVDGYAKITRLQC